MSMYDKNYYNIAGRFLTDSAIKKAQHPTCTNYTTKKLIKSSLTLLCLSLLYTPENSASLSTVFSESSSVIT